MPHADRADEMAQLVLDGITWCRYVCTIAEPHCGCRDHLATALRSYGREERERAEQERDAALEPFAKQAARFDEDPSFGTWNDDVEIWKTRNYRCQITVGDLRKARAVMVRSYGREERERAEQRLQQVEAALTRARDQFRWYEQLHRDKGATDKAERNAEMARMCDAALDRTQGDTDAGEVFQKEEKMERDSTY